MRWWAVSRRGVEFVRGDDTVYWRWPWLRDRPWESWNAWRSDGYMAAFDTYAEYVAFCESAELLQPATNSGRKGPE